MQVEEGEGGRDEVKYLGLGWYYILYRLKKEKGGDELKYLGLGGYYILCRVKYHLV